IESSLDLFFMPHETFQHLMWHSSDPWIVGKRYNCSLTDHQHRRIGYNSFPSFGIVMKEAERDDIHVGTTRRGEEQLLMENGRRGSRRGRKNNIAEFTTW